jgi:hypothetical protein
MRNEQKLQAAEIKAQAAQLAADIEGPVRATPRAINVVLEDGKRASARSKSVDLLRKHVAKTGGAASGGRSSSAKKERAAAPAPAPAPAPPAVKVKVKARAKIDHRADEDEEDTVVFFSDTDTDREEEGAKARGPPPPPAASPKAPAAPKAKPSAKGILRKSTPPTKKEEKELMKSFKRAVAKGTKASAKDAVKAVGTAKTGDLTDGETDDEGGRFVREGGGKVEGGGVFRGGGRRSVKIIETDSGDVQMGSF